MPNKQNIIQRIFGGAVQKAHLSFQEIFTGFVPADMNARDQLLAYQQWVYACVQAIAEAVSDINLRLFQLKDGDMIEVDTHELLDILFKVNPFQSKTDFLQLHQTYMDLSGESFWFLERGTDDPKPTDPIKEIWALRPDLVEIVPDRETFIKGYLYRGGAQQRIPLSVNEVIHFKYPNPLSPYRGLSPVKAAALAVDTHKFASEWNRNFFFNSARPDAVLQSDSVINDEQWKRLSAEWNANYRGVDRAHKVAVLENGIKYQQTGINQKEMDFFKQKNLTRDEILGIYRVPKAILGITEGVNVGNAEATHKIFLSQVIKKKMQRIIDTLNEFFVPAFGDNLILDFDDPTPENREAKVSEFERGHNKWLTINEIRNEEGLPPVSGGDIIYQPISLFPVGSVQEEEQMRMIKLKGGKPIDVRDKQRKAKLKAKLLAGNKRQKRIEVLRRKIQLIVEQKNESKKERKQREKIELLNENAKLSSQKELLEGQNVAKDQKIARLEREKKEAEKTAADALGLKNDTNTGTTEK